MSSKDTKKSTKRWVRVAVFVALALVMYFLEASIPPILVFAPGSKLGLSNLVLLCALILLGVVDAFVVAIVKVILSSILGGNPVNVLYAMPSSLLALFAMTLLYQCVFPKVSLMCISFVGAVVFNFVQLLVASLIVENIYIITMLPLMLLASVVAGLFVGICTYFVVKYMPARLFETTHTLPLDDLESTNPLGAQDILE